VTPEIEGFGGPQWLVTVRSSDDFSMTPVLERWDRSPDMVAIGVGFLVHGLLDEIVDGYFETVTQFDEYYDDISDGIFSDTPLGPGQQREWFEMRRTLARFSPLAAARPAAPASSGSGSRCGARWPASTGWWRRCGRRSARSCTASSSSPSQS